jgi:hypothetical protein
MNYKYIPSKSLGSQIVGLRQRPELDQTAISGNSFLPTHVTIGITSGYSLPVSNGSDKEVLSFNHSVPRRWDQASDITFSTICALDTANASKKFKLRLDWESYGAGDVLPVTTHTVTTETSIVTASQYTVYKVDFTIDYDIDTPNVIVAGDTLVGKLFRVAASSLEITGEVIILDWWINYWRGFYGGS